MERTTMAPMTISPLAGRPAPKEILVDLARLEREYYARGPDLADPNQLVGFGTSGHRGSPLDGAFNEAHILAITQAICEYRAARARRPALHGQGHPRALRARAADGARGARGQRRRNRHPAERRLHPDAGHLARDPRPQPRRTAARADGIVVTPSHNPPEDGGFKYNPPNGGPADTDVTSGSRTGRTSCCAAATRGEARAIREGHRGRDHAPGRLRPALRPGLENVIDMDAIRAAGLKLGVDPLGGAAGLLGADQLDLRPRHPVVNP